MTLILTELSIVAKKLVNIGKCNNYVFIYGIHSTVLCKQSSDDCACADRDNRGNRAKENGERVLSLSP